MTQDLSEKVPIQSWPG